MGMYKVASPVANRERHENIFPLPLIARLQFF
nr:MAG TPA: hypothetical protein [Caudoviricetes sp.]